jgi:hypothetical protein
MVGLATRTYGTGTGTGARWRGEVSRKSFVESEDAAKISSTNKTHPALNAKFER